jgi:hypothetical protein
MDSGYGMNAIDRWKIADRMQKRSGVWYYGATMSVEDAIDECVKIVEELTGIRKTDGIHSWERDTHKLWSKPVDIDHCPKCGEYLHDEMGHMCK